MLCAASRSGEALSGPGNPPVYRVELRSANAVRVLARVTLVHPHRRALDPFVSRLQQEGKHGEVRLVEEHTGAVVARRRVPPLTGG